jgi:hypothetical protein
LDQKNWKVDAVDLNVLMLSIVYRGVGIPVVWIVLSKAGASDTSERTTVMEIFCEPSAGELDFIGNNCPRPPKAHGVMDDRRKNIK